MKGQIDPNAIIDAFEALAIPAFSHIYEGKTRPEEYNVLHPLAKGGYGEVFLVERSGSIFAMKRIPKTIALQNMNSMFFMYEKDIMTTTQSEWLVHCHEAFQDDSFLYYIMDFIPGGDLMTLITRINKLNVEEIRFYGAEIIMAINALHTQGWVHRDLKPDNVLLDKSGHVKLGDFGTSIKLVDGRATSSFTVGTPDYVSRDLLVTVGDSVTYGPEVDYWTIGVILFELFYGAPPFYSDSLKGTYSKIANIEYVFPEDMPEDLKDLIKQLICKKEKRLDIGGIKKHPFFRGIDWDHLRDLKPPHIPRISSLKDHSNFSELEFIPDASRVSCGFKQFVGFTYDPRYSVNIIGALSQHPVSPSSSTAISEKNELKESERRLVEIRASLEHHLKQLEERRRELVNLSTEIGRKKNESESLNDRLKATKMELQDLNESILSKTTQLVSMRNMKLDEASKSSNSFCRVILDDVEELQKKLQHARVEEHLAKARKLVYWFYKENERLRNELSALNCSNEGEVELRKELRVKKTEIREYQQKLEQEAGIRMRLEEELSDMKAKLKREKMVVGRHTFKVLNAATNRELQINIDGNKLEVVNSAGSAANICLISSVYVRELKNNEFHHLSYKKRALCLKLFFLKEITKSSSSSNRRSLKSLEKEYDREMKILKGLNDLLRVLDGETRQDALLQQQGSIKKIEQLKQEIERAKKSTITEYEVGDDEKVYEFNNHLFYEKTVAKGTLCDHCNEVIYGVVGQAFCCRDCLMVVHKSCYVLGDVSCELNRAMNAGTNTSVICQTLEEREKIMRLIKFGAI